MRKKTTSWGSVATWYDELLDKGEGTYQHDVILPHLLRLLQIKKGEKLLDLACGPGFFARAFNEEGATVTGTDISPELIELAKKKTPKEIDYHVSPASDLSFIPDHTIDSITIVLAIQNIEDVHQVLHECARVLKPNSRLLIVLTHPAFRVPQQSSWMWDEEKYIQYRRIDGYLSEAKVGIKMHPGENPTEQTITFHRPLQYYVKSLAKAGFCISRLEEWISNRHGPKGRRAEAEERARKEIPLFLFLEAKILP